MKKLAKVTYLGDSSVFVHTSRKWNKYTFQQGIPLEITDKDDIAFYKKRGGFFVKESIPEKVIEKVKEVKEAVTPEKKPKTTKKKGK